MNRGTCEHLEKWVPFSLGRGPDVGTARYVSEAFDFDGVLTPEHAARSPQISGVGHHS
jgi:hypothetical protein